MLLTNNNASSIKPIEIKANVSIAINGKQVIVLFINGINANNKKVKIFSINYDKSNFSFIDVKNFFTQAIAKFGKSEIIPLLKTIQGLKLDKNELDEIAKI